MASGEGMKRRDFIMLIGGAALARPVAARAQRPARIGFLGFGTAAATADRVEALRAGLRDLGYLEGKNIVIDFRWAEVVDRLRELAAELVRENVDVIFGRLQPRSRSPDRRPRPSQSCSPPISIPSALVMCRASRDPAATSQDWRRYKRSSPASHWRCWRSRAARKKDRSALESYCATQSCFAGARNRRCQIGGLASTDTGANRRGIRGRIRDDDQRTR